MSDLGTAFSKVMANLSEVSFKKDAHNGGKGNNYITLDAINQKLLPKLRENDLSFIVHRDSEQNFWGTLLHMITMQEYTKCFGRIELEKTGKTKDGRDYELMNSAQAQGATLSYGRRYVTTCFFNLLVDPDTDGEIANQANKSGQNQGQNKEYPKIQGKEVTIANVEIGKRDLANKQGVLKTVVNLTTQEGETEGIWLNSLDSKNVKKTDGQLMVSAISQLLQRRDNSLFTLPYLMVEKLGLTEQTTRYLQEKKRTNTLSIESEQQSFDSVPF